MSEDGIILSEKHGVNASVTHCECCGKEIGLCLVNFVNLKENNNEHTAGNLCKS